MCRARCMPTLAVGMILRAPRYMPTASVGMPPDNFRPHHAKQCSKRYGDRRRNGADQQRPAEFAGKSVRRAGDHRQAFEHRKTSLAGRFRFGRLSRRPCKSSCPAARRSKAAETSLTRQQRGHRQRPSGKVRLGERLSDRSRGRKRFSSFTPARISRTVRAMPNSTEGGGTPGSWPMAIWV